MPSRQNYLSVCSQKWKLWKATVLSIGDKRNWKWEEFIIWRLPTFLIPKVANLNTHKVKSCKTHITPFSLTDHPNSLPVFCNSPPPFQEVQLSLTSSASIKSGEGLPGLSMSRKRTKVPQVMCRVHSIIYNKSVREYGLQPSISSGTHSPWFLNYGIFFLPLHTL